MKNLELNVIELSSEELRTIDAGSPIKEALEIAELAVSMAYNAGYAIGQAAYHLFN
ncbi:hypothetical protein [Aquimarina pacifica]|uniref:hypothetical protein n=1 Tax=Aquimarina pacifica TaxID=1296415 RepID=UPI0004B9F201|nr:hypothetical protein [Aquimarina pacifica]